MFLALVALGIYKSRVLTKYLASKITVEQEAQLLMLIEKGRPTDECKLLPSQLAALAKFKDRLFQSDPQNKSHVNFKLISDESVNAFTLPGGEIWLLSGLLKDVRNPSELAGVLAHEIEHVQRRHVIEAMLRATLFTALLNVMAGDVSSIVLVDPHTVAQIFSLKLSREMENEADEGAFVRLNSVGISPRAMNDFFSRLEKKVKMPKSLDFLSTHPASEERVRRFQLSEISQTTPAILTDAEWSDLLTSCQKTP